MSEKTKRTFTQEELLEAQRLYRKQWRDRNPDKVKASVNRYILKKAKELETLQQGDESHE